MSLTAERYRLPCVVEGSTPDTRFPTGAEVLILEIEGLDLRIAASPGRMTIRVDNGLYVLTDEDKRGLLDMLRHAGAITEEGQ